MKRLLAALSFFTRLPFWRLTNLSSADYERIVPLWSAAGIFTGGIMALVFALSTLVFPVGVGLTLAIASRILLTGALHEDGFADLCDGFGGGTTKERTLQIMKDSHIGTYGVIGLIIYLLLLWNALYSLATVLPTLELCGMIILIDIWSKRMSSTIISFLPYSRSQAEAKSHIVYATERLPYFTLTLSVLSLNAPILYLLFRWMKRRIDGYTGDCCGATFIIIELYNYLVLLILCKPFL